MAKKNTGKSFEELVQEIYQAFLDYENAEQGYKRIEVLHNVKLVGKTGNTHQIDVYWAFMLGGSKYETLVEVKDWKTPVKMEQINSFHDVLQDIPGAPKGFYVSRSGFQSGAINTAKHHGIELVTISGGSFSLNVSLNNIVTYYDKISVAIDETWAESAGVSLGEIERLGSLTTKEDFVLLDPEKNVLRLCDLMYDKAKPFYYEEDDIFHTIEEPLAGDWLWLTSDMKTPIVKIAGYAFECHNKSASTMLKSTMPEYIITNLSSSTKHLYNSATKSLQFNVS